jgi:hypothetical protein
MSLVVVSGGQNQVDRGADNPTSYIPNYHETRKGSFGPIQGYAMYVYVRCFFERFCHALLCHIFGME